MQLCPFEVLKYTCTFERVLETLLVLGAGRETKMFEPCFLEYIHYEFALLILMHHLLKKKKVRSSSAYWTLIYFFRSPYFEDGVQMTFFFKAKLNSFCVINIICSFCVVHTNSSRNKQILNNFYSMIYWLRN